jgi:hypothetical protein
MSLAASADIQTDIELEGADDDERKSGEQPSPGLGNFKASSSAQDCKARSNTTRSLFDRWVHLDVEPVF